MHARVQQWGNRLAVRIPESLAAELGFEAGTLVGLTIKEGTLIVAPIASLTYRLRNLVAGVDESNIHVEVPAGRQRGNETW